MAEFGDDLIIESYRIPWLIWIQFLVMFLLTLAILLSYFAIDSSANADDSLISSPPPLVDRHSICLQRTQVVGDHDSRQDMPTITGSTARRVENNTEREGPSSKDLVTTRGSVRFFHPCRYFDLARQAFLSCLGFGSTSQKSRGRGHEHED